MLILLMDRMNAHLFMSSSPQSGLEVT